MCVSVICHRHRLPWNFTDFILFRFFSRLHCRKYSLAWFFLGAVDTLRASITNDFKGFSPNRSILSRALIHAPPSHTCAPLVGRQSKRFLASAMRWRYGNSIKYPIAATFYQNATHMHDFGKLLSPPMPPWPDAAVNIHSPESTRLLGHLMLSPLVITVVRFRYSMYSTPSILIWFIVVAMLHGISVFHIYTYGIVSIYSTIRYVCLCVCVCESLDPSLVYLFLCAQTFWS